jgi:hypothetical protein
MKIRLALYAGLGLAAMALSSCSAANSVNGYANRMMESVQRTVGLAQ